MKNVGFIYTETNKSFYSVHIILLYMKCFIKYAARHRHSNVMGPNKCNTLLGKATKLSNA